VKRWLGAYLCRLGWHRWREVDLPDLGPAEKLEVCCCGMGRHWYFHGAAYAILSVREMQRRAELAETKR
jgi:hypothetical protein